MQKRSGVSSSYHGDQIIPINDNVKTISQRRRSNSPRRISYHSPRRESYNTWKGQSISTPSCNKKPFGNSPELSKSVPHGLGRSPSRRRTLSERFSKLWNHDECVVDLDGDSLDSQLENIPRYTWDDVKTITRLDSGAFADVFKVACPKTSHEKHALKCLRRNGVHWTRRKLSIAADDLEREARILAQLKHPNIIRINGVGIPNDKDSDSDDNSSSSDDNESGERLHQFPYQFLVLELLQDTLQERLQEWRKAQRQQLLQFLVYKPKTETHRSRGQIPPLHKRLHSIAFKLCKTLTYLHAQKIIHCDLKPANIGFDRNDQLKIFDFGMARDLLNEGSHQERKDTVLDCCRYMAPEVMLNKHVSYSADVYSFGVIVWELVTLKSAYHDIKQNDDVKDRVAVKEIRPELSFKLIESQRVRNLLEESWSPHPRLRPKFTRLQKDMMEILVELRARENELSKASPRNSFRRKSSLRSLWRVFPKQEPSEETSSLNASSYHDRDPSADFSNYMFGDEF